MAWHLKTFSGISRGGRSIRNSELRGHYPPPTYELQGLQLYLNGQLVAQTSDTFEWSPPGYRFTNSLAPIVDALIRCKVKPRNLWKYLRGWKAVQD